MNERYILKPEKYNPKAREAFGKSLIDIGVGIFKGIMLLFTVAPMTFLLKGALDGTSNGALLSALWKFLTSPMYFVFIAILAAAFAIGHYFRQEGLRHIHEIENKRPPNEPTEVLGRNPPASNVRQKSYAGEKIDPGA
jgi:hypothetical protein